MKIINHRVSESLRFLRGRGDADTDIGREHIPSLESHFPKAVKLESHSTAVDSKFYRHSQTLGRRILQGLEFQ